METGEDVKLEELEENEVETDIDSAIEEMGEAGELEVLREEPEKKEAKEDTKPESEASEKTNIVIEGKEYTPEQIAELVKKTNENKEKWQAELTQKSQKQAEERKALEAEREAFFAEKRKAAEGDTVLLETIDILEKQEKELREMKQAQAERAESERMEKEERAARSRVQAYIDDARKAGIDVPDIDSPDFATIREVARTVKFNPVLEAMKVLGKKGKANVDGLKTVESKKLPPTSHGMAQSDIQKINELAKEYGLDPASVRSRM